MIGGINHYGYALNNPINIIDPWGLSSLYYDHNSNEIILYDSAGNEIARDTAHNNVDSSVPEGGFPDGTHDIREELPAHQTHPDDAPNSRFGSYGSLNFDVENRTDMAVHSGRENDADGLGRTGTEHATMGCIRTTDPMMETIIEMHNSNDPITDITVGNTPPDNTDCE